MKISADWISTPATQRVMTLLTDARHQALFVGGCVRNTLMAQPVNDIDIATDATPDQILALTQNAAVTAIPTGIAHGTVTLVVDRIPHEVTTFRRDVATDGRRAVVAFSSDIAEDAARRDFTMNALYADRTGLIHDPLNGLPDVQAGYVRFIGQAEDRIQEDYLRILRFFRFYAWYGCGAPDAPGLKACAALAEGMACLSTERITAEMIKLLSAPDPAPAVLHMQHADVLRYVLPGASGDALPALTALDQAYPVRWSRRLAVLGGEVNRLRLSRAQTRMLKDLEAATAYEDIAERAYRLGQDAARDSALIAAAQGAALPASLESDIAKGLSAVFPLTSADLMPGIPPGPQLGQVLAALETRWIKSGFTAGRDDLLSTLA